MSEITNPKQKIDFIYNPDNQSKRQLISSFVVRLRTFERLFLDIQNSKMKSPEQHYLIEGKRGMGKTTLLLRLGYEVENDKKLNSWLIPIVFNEEEYSIRRLYKLWERIAKLLEEKDDDFIGLEDKMDNSFDNYDSDEDYEYNIFLMLNEYLEKCSKKLILFIDNFGDIFKKFSTQEIQRLRTILQTNTNFRVIGASSTVLEAFYDNRHPFFELFKVVRLGGLNKGETKDLLLKLGESYKQEQLIDIIENQPGRIEALRRLTGGVIRTVVLLSEIFIDQEKGNAFMDLEAILDRVTPLYKHRMDDLPAQQQEIVEAIAFAWDAINVSEISQKTRIKSKTVSAQLAQMEKNEIITKKLTSNKNHFYQISERFFNIWYLMRHGRKGDKRKVLWLVRFLEEWCDQGELVARVQKHIGNMNSGSYNLDGAYYLTEALASTQALPSSYQDELIKATRAFLINNKSEFVQHLSQSDLELLEKAKIFSKNEDFNSALSILLKMKDKNELEIGVCYRELKEFKLAEKHFNIELKKENATSMRLLANLNSEHFNNHKEAEKLFLNAIEKGDDLSLHGLALLYMNKFEDYIKAKKYYLQAIEKGDTDAIYGLALLYAYRLNDYNKAEEYYLMAIEKGNLNAYDSLGILYEIKLENYEKAKECYLKAIEQKNSLSYYHLASLYTFQLNDIKNGEDYYLKSIKEGNNNAMQELGYLYEHMMDDFIKAEEFYLMAQENGNLDSNSSLAFLYAYKMEDLPKAEKYFLDAVGNDVEAMCNLANFYSIKYKDFIKAEKYYLMAIDNGDVKGYRGMGLLNSIELKDYKKAEKYYLKAIEKGDVVSMRNIAMLYRNKLINLTKSQKYFLKAIKNGDIESLGAIAQLYKYDLIDFKKAEKYYSLGAEKGDTDAMFRLANLYENDLKNYKKAEFYYLMGIENGNIDSINNLAFMYYSLKINKVKALELAEQAYEEENDDASRLTYAKNLLWNNQSIESIEIAQQFIFDEKYLTDYLEYFADYLHLLIAKKQYQFLLDYMNSTSNGLKIKDQLKPIWYVLMFYLKDEFPNEYLRMGDELQETVKEIIERVEQMIIEYV
jgi:TPR repeat protein